MMSFGPWDADPVAQADPVDLVAPVVKEVLAVLVLEAEEDLVAADLVVLPVVVLPVVVLVELVADPVLLEIQVADRRVDVLDREDPRVDQKGADLMDLHLLPIQIGCTNTRWNLMVTKMANSMQRS
jgi:hypothetical protein